MTSNEAKVNLTDLIAPSFYKLHWDVLDGKHVHYKLAGGRGSTKSTFISIHILLGMLQDKNAHALILRQVGNTLADSVFAQMQWAISALKMSHLWKVSKSPLGLEYKPTGQRIFFRGADDPEKIKGIKIKFGSIKYLWFEEYSQFAGAEAARNIRQSVLRGETLEDPRCFYSWNPPKSINNWVNQDILGEQSIDTIVHQSDYRSVPRQWLGNQFIIEAEHLAKTKPDAYKHEYLGIAIGTGGQVFSNVTVRKITDDEIKQFDRIRQGIDWGYAADPFAYIKGHYDKTRRRLFLFDEIYQVQLSNAKAFKEVIKRNMLNQLVIADSAEPKSIAEGKENGLNIKGAKKGPDSVEYGIKFLQDLEEIIIDSDRCPNAKREFTGYELERDKNDNFKGTYPDKDNHTIDAGRYMLSEDMPKKGSWSL